jgi:carbon storage regulator
MLVLTRKYNQSIMLGDDIEVVIVDIKGDQVKIGIKAPRTLTILRKEIFKEITDENIEATKATPEHVGAALDKLLKTRPPQEPGQKKSGLILKKPKND